MSKQHATAISNSEGSSSRGGKKVSFRRAMDDREQGWRHQRPEGGRGPQRQQEVELVGGGQ
jgi:hypothetical protein